MERVETLLKIEFDSEPVYGDNDEQPSKFASAFAKENLLFLRCIGKLLPKRNFRNNFHVNFWINHCKKLKKSSFLYPFWTNSHNCNHSNKTKKNKEKRKKLCSLNKTLVGMKESARGVNWRCFVNKDFWKHVQISQENISLQSLFNEVPSLEAYSFIKNWL